MPKSLKKLRSNRAWIERHINDPFVKKSRREGYRARSVYKLTELDDTEHLFRPGMNVADLGSAPGSWTQIVRERLTDKNGELKGRIIAMDILPMEPIDAGTMIIDSKRAEPLAAGQNMSLLSYRTMRSDSGRRSPSYSMTRRPLSLTMRAICSMSGAPSSRSAHCRAYIAPLAPVTANITFIRSHFTTL